MNSINNILGQKFSYLSIDFEGLEMQDLLLKQITLEALNKINEKFNLPEESRTKDILNLLENNKINEIETELGFKFPHKNKSDHWHLTTFFKSKQRSELSEDAKKALLDFEKNKIISVNVLAFIYIPNKLMTLLCRPTCAIQNKYPHITLLVKNVNPYFSNIVLETIFDNDEYMKKDYEEVFNNLKSEEVSNDITIENIKHCLIDNLDFNEEDCYVYFFDKEKFKIEGKMKFNF